MTHGPGPSGPPPQNPQGQPYQGQPAPGWEQGPQPGYAPAPAQGFVGGSAPAPGGPRKRPWAIIAVALGCVALLVVAVAGGLGFLLWGSLGDDPTPTAAPSTETTSPTEDPTTTPSGSETSTFTPLSAYEDTTLTADEIEVVLATSPLTSGTYPAVGSCELPAITAAPTEAELQAFLEAGAGCLSGSWSQLLSDKNLTWDTPAIRVFTWPDIPAESSCEAATFDQYSPRMCNLDKVLYWPLGATRYVPLAAPEDVGSAYLADLSYALMNTVSWQTTISVYFNHYSGDFEESDPAWRDGYRRFNLQMRCLSTVAVMQLPEGVRPSAALQAVMLDEATWPPGEDPRSIPSSAMVRWVNLGIGSGGDLAVCNAWTADSADIDT